MADTDTIVSQLPNASQINNADLVMLTQPNAQAETGYSTAKTTALDVAKKVASGVEYTTDLANFTAKTLTGAINENRNALYPITPKSAELINFNTSYAIPLNKAKFNIPYKASGYTGMKITHSNSVSSNDWEYIKKMVRSGKARQKYPLGTTFTVTKNFDTYTAVNITFVVVGYDYAMPTGVSHSMVLESKCVYSGRYSDQYIQYDGPEALYYAENGLAAGTYCFTWSYSAGSVASGTYEFTLTTAVPAGGQVVITGTNGTTKALTNCTISTYSAIGDRTALESGVAITSNASSTGTSLGSVSQNALSADGKLNAGGRILYGSNNYAQSALRQFLNSDVANGAYWTPQTKFDRAPNSWSTTLDYSGYLYGLEEGFVNAVHTAKIPCIAGNCVVDSLNGDQYQRHSIYYLEDKFFLLSRGEYFGTYDYPHPAQHDGTILEYYVGAEASKMKKTGSSSSSGRNVFMRTEHETGTCNLEYISSTGSLGNSTSQGYANNTSYYICPACIIA